MAIVFETNNITINGHPVVRTGMIITPHVVGGSSGAGVPNSSFPEFLAKNYVNFRFNIDINGSQTTYTGNGENSAHYWKLEIYDGSFMEEEDKIQFYYFFDPFEDTNNNTVQHTEGYKARSLQCVGNVCGALNSGEAETLKIPLSASGWNAPRTFYWKLKPWRVYNNNGNQTSNFSMGSITGSVVVPAAFKFSSDSAVADAPWANYQWNSNSANESALLEVRKNALDNANNSVSSNTIWNPDSKNRMYAHSFKEIILRTNGTDPAGASSSTWNDNNSIIYDDNTSMRQPNDQNLNTRLNYRQVKQIVDSWWWSGHTYQIKLFAYDREGNVLDTRIENFAPPATINNGGFRSDFAGYHEYANDATAVPVKQTGNNRPKLNLRIRSTNTSGTEHAAYHHIEIRHVSGGQVKQRFSVNGFDNTGTLIDYSSLQYIEGVVELNEAVIPNIEYNQELYITFRAKTNTHTPSTVSNSGGDISSKEFAVEYIAYKDWEFSSDFADGLAIETPTVDVVTGEFNIGNLYVYTDHNDGTAHWFKTVIEYRDKNGNLIGDQQQAITGINGEASASLNGAGLQTRTRNNGSTYYRLALGNDMFTSPDLNTKFESIYDVHGYIMDIKVQALDNEFNVMDSTHADGDFHRYDFSDSYGVEGAVFSGAETDGNSELAFQEDTSVSQVGLTRWLRPVFRQVSSDGSTTAVSMSLQYKKNGVLQTVQKYFSEGFGASNFTGHARTNWIKADDLNDYQTKLAAGVTPSKIYLADIGSSIDTSLFKDVEYEAILYFYDDNGNTLDIAFGEELTVEGYDVYQFDDYSLSSNNNKTNTLDNFYVQAYSKDNGGNRYFDYMKLEIREKSNHNNIFTPRSLSNGNSFWNTGTFTWDKYITGSTTKDLDISPVISDRFVDTELEFRLRVVSSGATASDSFYHIRNGDWTDFTVPKITYDFGNLTMGIHNNVNNFSTVNVQVGFSPGSKHTNYANKFRLRVWDNIFHDYATSSANSKIEFILNGATFTSSDQLRSVDENGNTLDISPIMAQWGRWESNLVKYEIAALKSDNTVISSQVKGFSVPAVDWNMHSDTSLIMITDNIDETKTKLRVYRVDNADTIPYIQIGIRVKTNVDGTAPSTTSYYERFDTTVFDSPGGSLFEDFEFIFPEGLDRNKASVYEYTITGQVEDGSGGYQTLGQILTKELAYTPWYKPNTITVSLSKSDITEKRAAVTVQPLLATHLTRQPTTVKLRFIRDNDPNKKVEYNFNSNFNNFSGTFDIGNIYTDAPLTNTLLKCEVLPQSAENIKQTSSNITIPAEPQFTIQESSQGKNVIIDDSGNEYVAFRFKPQIQSNFIPAGQKYTLNFMIGDSISESIEVDGSTLDNNYLSYSLPTGFNVSNNYTQQVYNNAKMSASYTMNRTFDDQNIITTNLTMTQNKRTNAYNAFPAQLNVLEHGFDSNGNGEITMSYQNVLKTYETQLSSYWDIQALFKEEVKNSLNSSIIGTDKETDVSSTFKNNNFSITVKNPTEANYLSDIELTVQEKFKNQEAFGSASTWALYKAGDLNPSNPTFLDVYENTKTFSKDDVLMNDISKYPLTDSALTEFEVENIFGDYLLSGRRMKFKLSNQALPFTNTESYYGFGIKINHDTNQNQKADSSGLYIKSDGSLYYSQDPINDPEVDNIKNLYTLNQLSSDGEWYYVDTEIDLTEANFDSPIWDDDDLQIKHKLLLYKEILATTYDSPNQANKVSSIEYTDLDSWANSLSSSSESLKQSFSNINASVVAFGGKVEESPEIAKVKLTSSYRLVDKKTIPYFGSLPTGGAKIKIKNSSNQVLNSDTFQGSTFSESISNLESTLGSKSLLNTKGYDPRNDIIISSVPTTTTKSSIGNIDFYSNIIEFSDNLNDITVNYSNKIIPSFNELTVDNDLNEDTVAGSSEHKNKIFWIYNKQQLKNCVEVFSYSKEFVKIIRKIKQGNNVYEGLESNETCHFLSDLHDSAVFTSSSLDSDNFKFELEDNDISIAKYVNEGLDPNKPYIFNYEITPCFRYKAADDNEHHLIEVSDKKVSSYIIPDEFPISNGGVTGVNINYNSKHSVEINWGHVYNSSVVTLHSIEAKISFELYYYYDETYSRKNHSNEKTKPKLKRLERILQKQQTPDSWTFIDNVSYTFPSSPEEDKAYPYSYIWEYEKLETDSSLSIVILTKIESEFVGAAISQNITDRGPVNTVTIDLVETDDKNRKNKLIADSDIKFESLRHLLRSEEFILKANLEQAPFSVTRKKAKVRVSDKPYSSST